MNPEIARLANIDAVARTKVAVVTWSRLEPMALSRGDLTPGLQALIGDPLWLLGRQWQFEELRGEDAGSPIRAAVHGEHAAVTRFHPGRLAGAADPATNSVDSPSVPVEVAVEAELPAILPERIRAHSGQQLVRLLRVADPTGGVAASAIAAWAFSPPPPDLASVDPGGAARRRVLAGRVVDGAFVEAALEGVVDAAGVVSDLPAVLAQTPAGAAAAVRDALGAWLAWHRGYLARPVGRSWDPHRLEYGFALQADLQQGHAVLDADGYADGTIDWYSFDAKDGPSLGAPTTAVVPSAIEETILPSPVRYPGMPADRLFQFEDARVYLGGIEAGPTDIARMALRDYALVFGNDWYLVPVDLPYGSVARIDKVVVTDTFGVVSNVGPARQVTRPGWTLFHLPSRDDGGRLADLFVLPGTVRKPLEGDPLEEVALFRDEMANLVWAVERVVQGPTGEPVPWNRMAARVSLRQQPVGDLDDAKIIYRLMTPVPENWIPFVAVPAAGRPAGAFTTELERRPMIRFLEEGPQLVHPRGTLLRTSDDADILVDRLRVAEEEVPRDGIVVTRTYQLARTTGGGSVLWIGRAKQTGQGEGASGLKFDTALPAGST